MKALDVLRAALAQAAAKLGAPGAEVLLERPKDPAHGDVATNLALALAKTLKAKPRDVAEKVVAALELPPGFARKVEIAGPGFINFFLAGEQVVAVLPAILAAGAVYGRSDIGKGAKVNVEFVSANPTGPLHVGHGRQAAIGDAIATLLEWTGWNVTREFYYNDAGAQIGNLMMSVWVRLKELAGEHDEIPEGGYHGEYIKELAQRFAEKHGAHKSMGVQETIRRLRHLLEFVDREEIRKFAVEAMREEQDRDLIAFGVKFDVHFLESSLYATGRVDEVVRGLIESGHTYQEGGALWLRTTSFGDDKDRVIQRSAERGGNYTYFVPDVAYHVDKWRRGFKKAINVQGGDHYSTVARVRIGLQALALGIPPDYPEYVLHQIVTVVRGGEEVRISKRAGSYVTVRELVDEVGADALRYFFLMRRSDSQLVFDVDLAKSQTEDNPVFYVQMAHARLCGIFRTAGIAPETVDLESVDLGVLVQAEELELIQELAAFPATVQRAAETREPQRIPAYLTNLARLTHGWYHKYRVLGEREEAARLVLARAVRQVLANGLTLLGIRAPERM